MTPLCDVLWVQYGVLGEPTRRPVVLVRDPKPTSPHDRAALQIGGIKRSAPGVPQPRHANKWGNNPASPEHRCARHGAAAGDPLLGAARRGVPLCYDGRCVVFCAVSNCVVLCCTLSHNVALCAVCCGVWCAVYHAVCCALLCDACCVVPWHFLRPLHCVLCCSFLCCIQCMLSALCASRVRVPLTGPNASAGSRARRRTPCVRPSKPRKRQHLLVYDSMCRPPPSCHLAWGSGGANTSCHRIYTCCAVRNAQRRTGDQSTMQERRHRALTPPAQLPQLSLCSLQRQPPLAKHFWEGSSSRYLLLRTFSCSSVFRRVN